MNKAKRARLEELIDEASVDCYDEDEQHTGLLTMIEDNNVEIIGFEWPKSGYGLLAVCERGGKKHLVDITSLEWMKPYPEGYEWIEAYLLWKGYIQ